MRSTRSVLLLVMLTLSVLMGWIAGNNFTVHPAWLLVIWPVTGAIITALQLLFVKPVNKVTAVLAAAWFASLGVVAFCVAAVKH